MSKIVRDSVHSHFMKIQFLFILYLPAFPNNAWVVNFHHVYLPLPPRAFFIGKLPKILLGFENVKFKGELDQIKEFGSNFLTGQQVIMKHLLAKHGL